MSTSVSQRALIVVENLWIGELVIQQREVEETKLGSPLQRASPGTRKDQI